MITSPKPKELHPILALRIEGDNASRDRLLVLAMPTAFPENHTIFRELWGFAWPVMGLIWFGKIIPLTFGSTKHALAPFLLKDLVSKRLLQGHSLINDIPSTPLDVKRLRHQIGYSGCIWAIHRRNDGWKIIPVDMGSKVGPLGGMDSNSLKQDEMPPHVSASDPWQQRIWMDPSKLPYLEMLRFTFLQPLNMRFCQEAMENTFQTTRNLPLLEIRTSLVIICLDEMWWTCLYNPTTSFQKPKSTLFPQFAQQNISQRHHKSVSICKALSFLMVRILTGMTRWPFHIISPFRKHPRTEQFIQRGSKESLLHSVIPYIENQIARSCCQLLDNFLEILYDSPKSWLGCVERF